MLTNVVDLEQVAIHPVLEDTHPLDIGRFNLLRRGDIDEANLDPAASEWLEHVKQLAQNIDSEGLENPVKLAMGPNGRPTLTQGYTRYCACLWVDVEPDWEESEHGVDEQAVALHMLAEDQNRWPTDGEARAIAIASALGAWNHETQSYRQPSQVDEGRTVQELAESLGRDTSTIYRWLSPLRQSDAVREDFHPALAEDLLHRIETLAPDEASQYGLAQAVVQSEHVGTRADFREVLERVEAELEAPSTRELVDALHDRIRNPPRQSRTPTPTTESPTSPGPDAGDPTGGAEAGVDSASRIAARELEREKKWHDRKPTATPSSDDEPPTESTRDSTRDDGGRGPDRPGSGAGSRQSTLSEYVVEIDEPALEEALRQDAEAHGLSVEDAIVQILETHYRERGELEPEPTGRVPTPR